MSKDKKINLAAFSVLTGSILVLLLIVGQICGELNIGIISLPIIIIYFGVFLFGRVITFAVLICGLIAGLIALKDKYHRILAITGIILNIGSLLFLDGVSQEGFFASSKHVVLKNDRVINGISFSKGSDITYFKRGKPFSATLGIDQKIQNITFPKGTTVEFGETGYIVSAKLPFNYEIQGIKCSPGDPVYFDYKSGKITSAQLAENLDTQGVLFPKGIGVTFDDTGKITDARSHFDTPDKPIIVIKGIKFIEVSFYDNKIRGKLAEDQDVQGYKFQKGSDVTFSEDGKLDSVRLEGDFEINGLKFKEYSYLEFYESGKLKAASMRDSVINGMKFDDGDVYYDENGQFDHLKALNIELSEDKNIQGINFLKGTKVKFSDSNRLEWVISPEDLDIEGIKYAKSKPIYFYNDGRIWGGVLAYDQEISGYKLFAGREVSYDRNGDLEDTIETFALKEDKVINGTRYKKGTELQMDIYGNIR